MGDGEAVGRQGQLTGVDSPVAPGDVGGEGGQVGEEGKEGQEAEKHPRGGPEPDYLWFGRPAGRVRYGYPSSRRHMVREQADYKAEAVSERQARRALELARSFVASAREGGEKR